MLSYLTDVCAASRRTDDSFHTTATSHPPSDTLSILQCLSICTFYSVLCVRAILKSSYWFLSLYPVLTVVCMCENPVHNHSSRTDTLASFTSQKSATIDCEVVNETKVSMRPQSCRRIDHGLLLLLLSFCVTSIMECARQCAVFFFPRQERENKIKEHLIQIFQKICRYLVLAIHKKYKRKLFTCVQTNRHVHP